MMERASTSCSLASECISQRLRIHIATFNMGGKVPPALPPGMLGPPDQQQQESEHQCQEVDLFVFATQVCTGTWQCGVLPTRRCCSVHDWLHANARPAS
jgi:hypothetical protein